MEKARLIRETLAALRQRFGGRFAVVDHWDADLTAVGVGAADDPGRLVHFSIFKRRRGRYYVSLELPPQVGEDFPYVQGAVFEDIDFEQLAAIVAEHLGIQASAGI